MAGAMRSGEIVEAFPLASSGVCHACQAAQATREREPSAASSLASCHLSASSLRSGKHDRVCRSLEGPTSCMLDQLKREGKLKLGGAYMIVIVFEPLADLLILPLLKRPMLSEAARW